MSDTAAPTNYLAPAVGSDPHGHYQAQQDLYSQLVEQSRTPKGPYYPAASVGSSAGDSE